MASCGPYIYGQISALSLLLVRHQYHQFPPIDSPALIVNCSLSMLTSPNILYVYDLELSEDVMCKKNDEEVQDFQLMSIQDVRDSLLCREFKPNCALVLIYFLMR